MKLGDEKLQGKFFFGETKFRGVGIHPLEQIDGPTASDIVRNLDHSDLLVFHRGKEDIIHVDEPN